jgi:hypothetical protein
MEAIRAVTRVKAEVHRPNTNSVVIRDATAQDVGSIAQLIASMTARDELEVRNRIDRLRSAPWSGRNTDYGCVLEADAGIVGFIGWTTVDRLLRGKQQMIRNISHWFVRESHRRYSLKLAERTLALEDATFTVLTANEAVVNVWKLLRFRTFEDGMRVVYPSLRLRSPRITLLSDRFEHQLSQEQLQIHLDHRDLPCHQACLTSDDDHCLIIASRKARWPFSYARVLYVSNRPFLSAHIRDVANALCRRWRVAALRFDARLAPAIPWTRYRKLKSPFMYRSSRLSADDIDALYSEVVLFGI